MGLGQRFLTGLDVYDTFSGRNGQIVEMNLDSAATTPLAPFYVGCYFIVKLNDGTKVVFTQEGARVGVGCPALTEVVFLDNIADALNSTYFLISSTTTDYYVWFNSSTLGVDPAVANRTGIEVAIVTGDSAIDVALAVLAALPGADFTVYLLGAALLVLNTAPGAVTPAAAGTSGFTLASVQGGMDDISEGPTLLTKAEHNAALSVGYPDSGN